MTWATCIALGAVTIYQRLVSPQPAQYVGTRNYERLLRVAVLPLEPVVDPQTGQPQRDADGIVQFPRSREFTRDAVKYPQYADMKLVTTAGDVLAMTPVRVVAWRAID